MAPRAYLLLPLAALATACSSWTMRPAVLLADDFDGENQGVYQLNYAGYRLEFKMSGTPRPNQPPNTVIVSVGDRFSQTITLASYTPLQAYSLTFRVDRAASARVSFQHLGGDDYGNFIDDVRFERL